MERPEGRTLTNEEYFTSLVVSENEVVSGNSIVGLMPYWKGETFFCTSLS